MVKLMLQRGGVSLHELSRNPHAQLLRMAA